MATCHCMMPDLKSGAKGDLSKQFAYRLTRQYVRRTMDEFRRGDDSVSDDIDGGSSFNG